MQLSSFFTLLLGIISLVVAQQLLFYRDTSILLDSYCKLLTKTEKVDSLINKKKFQRLQGQTLSSIIRDSKKDEESRPKKVIKTMPNRFLPSQKIRAKLHISSEIDSKTTIDVLFKSLSQMYPKTLFSQYKTTPKDFAKDLYQAAVKVSSTKHPSIQSIASMMKNEELFYVLYEGSIVYNLSEKSGIPPLTDTIHLFSPNASKLLYFHHANPVFIEALLGKQLASKLFDHEQKRLKEKNAKPMTRSEVYEFLTTEHAHPRTLDIVENVMSFGSVRDSIEQETIQVTESSYDIPLKREAKF